MKQYEKEISEGKRFKFGQNWLRFLTVLDEDRIITAKNSLITMLKMKTLEELSFLDIGSGSGLFSLAARKLGAKVTSVDYDPQSVECTAELKQRYFKNDNYWKIERGSVFRHFRIDMGTIIGQKFKKVAGFYEPFLKK